MKPTVLLFLAVCAIAQTSTAPTPLAPISGFDRQQLIEDMRQAAEGRRWFAEFYAGGGNTIGGTYSYNLADGMDWAADFVESWAPHAPAGDPVETRHEDELTVINTLRVAMGLPPYDEYPTP